MKYVLEWRVRPGIGGQQAEADARRAYPTKGKKRMKKTLITVAAAGVLALPFSAVVFSPAAHAYNYCLVYAPGSASANADLYSQCMTRLQNGCNLTHIQADCQQLASGPPPGIQPGPAPAPAPGCPPGLSPGDQLACTALQNGAQP